MTAAEFNELNIDQKANLLCAYGDLVHTRMEYKKFIICIYAMGGFYVDLCYCSKDNLVRRIKAMESTSDWQGYLECEDMNRLMDQIVA